MPLSQKSFLRIHVDITLGLMTSSLEAVWDSAQPKLVEIQASLSELKLENPRIIRVGQLDSELLDQELAQLLKEPIDKALSLISVCSVAQLSQFLMVNPTIYESQD
jgi:peroxin-2